MKEKKPKAEWPEEGVVEFEGYGTRYRPGLDLVVKNLNCKIQSGEKVGKKLYLSQTELCFNDLEEEGFETLREKEKYQAISNTMETCLILSLLTKCTTFIHPSWKHL